MATITTGMYKITNNVNGKIYVGQSVNIKKRWEYYIYPNNKDKTPILYAIKKYGVKSFSFEIIEECHVDLLNDREIFWISSMPAKAPQGYNLSTGGRKTTWLYKPSKETLIKRSIALTGKKRTQETKEKMSKAQKGKVLSESHKEKLSKAHKGKVANNKGKKMSDLTKAKVSASKLGISAYWRKVKLTRNDGVEFNSVKSASEYIGAHRTTILKQLAGKLKTVHGFSFIRTGA